MSEYRQLVGQRAVADAGARPVPRSPYRSKLEARYAAELERLRAAGLVRTWSYESLRFRIGKDCWYTPDFVVVRPDGGVDAHEVKGWMRDDARVKLKAAASLYPWMGFVLVTDARRQRGFADWHQERVE